MKKLVLIALFLSASLLANEGQEKPFFRASKEQPYHLSIGAVLFDQQGRIACHHLNEIFGYKDIYILMRETVENGESPLETLSRGLKEEFGASGQPVAFLGSLAGYLPSLSFEKTTLYIACRLIDWDPQKRDLHDPEAASTIEWLEPNQLILLMKEQGRRLGRIDVDESEMVLRALPYLQLRAGYIIIHAMRHILELYDADGSLKKAYSVGLGKNGVFKTQKGDGKTPVGEYHILWKASRYAESDGGFLIAEEKAYCRNDNTFSIESEEGKGSIWDQRYGGDQAVFMCLDYPNLSDQAKGYTGCGIAIHAAFEGVGEDSSLGCIRMVPSDARDLYRNVVEGTAVIIKND